MRFPILDECVFFLPNPLFNGKILLIWLTSIDQAGPLDFLGWMVDILAGPYRKKTSFLPASREPGFLDDIEMDSADRRCIVVEDPIIMFLPNCPPSEVN
jgi:hypothetical protein